MPKFNCTVIEEVIEVYKNVLVEADTEDEAREKALARVTEEGQLACVCDGDHEYADVERSVETVTEVR